MISRRLLQWSVIAVILIIAVICSGCLANGKDIQVPVPDTAVKNWQVTLNGSSEKVLRVDDLKRFPVVTGHGYLVSTTGIRFGPYICTGVDLRDLIADVGGMNPGDRIWISSTDGYLWVFAADQLDGKGFVTFNASLKEIPSPPLRIILMYEQDKKPVSYDDGGPVRIAIVSEEKGVVTEGGAWVKWVNKIEIKKK